MRIEVQKGEKLELLTQTDSSEKLSRGGREPASSMKGGAYWNRNINSYTYIPVN